MAWGARWGLKPRLPEIMEIVEWRLNGLGSPLGIETPEILFDISLMAEAKWPGEPVGD